MKVDGTLVQAAFQQHLWRYGKRERAWDIQHHVDLWNTARLAFDGKGSLDDFERLYADLRSRWQAFRAGRTNWSAKQCFSKLRRLASPYSTMRLSELTAADTLGLWSTLQAVKDLKRNKHGPSVVAISKFLHFWNPKLFVIVDDAVVWKWVFGHQWLWDQVKATRQEVDGSIFGGPRRRSDVVCDLSTYLAILMWCGRLVRGNAAIVSCFSDYLLKNPDLTDVPHDLLTYEAAAVEWFLLGVVEIPPAGATLAS